MIWSMAAGWSPAGWYLEMSLNFFSSIRFIVSKVDGCLKVGFGLAWGGFFGRMGVVCLAPVVQRIGHRFAEAAI